MAITSEIIGKLGGGADVEVATVAGREITTSNTVVHTVEVPPGKSLLVGFVCRFSKIATTSGNWPEMKIGNTAVKCERTYTDAGISAVITETSDITISAGNGNIGATLTGGTVYTAEM